MMFSNIQLRIALLSVLGVLAEAVARMLFLTLHEIATPESILSFSFHLISATRYLSKEHLYSIHGYGLFIFDLLE